MRSKIILAIVATTLLCACSNGSDVEVTADPDAMLANGMTARQAAKARELNMKDLGGSFKTINDVLKLDQPDLNAIELAAKDVKYASDELIYWFAEGSGPETGLEMEAKINIWREWDQFTTLNNDFQTAARTLYQTAQNGDPSAIAKQAERVGEQCKACHDRYREEDD